MDTWRERGICNDVPQLSQLLFGLSLLLWCQLDITRPNTFQILRYLVFFPKIVASVVKGRGANFGEEILVDAQINQGFEYAQLPATNRFMDCFDRNKEEKQFSDCERQVNKLTQNERLRIPVHPFLSPSWSFSGAECATCWIPATSPLATRIKTCSCSTVFYDGEKKERCSWCESNAFKIPLTTNIHQYLRLSSHPD